MNKKLDVLLCLDSNVAIGTGTLIYSLGYNNPNIDFVVHICYGGGEVDFIKKTIHERLVASSLKNISLQYFDVFSHPDIKKLECKLHEVMKQGCRNLTLPTMFRLFAINHVKTCTDKLLYIDTDVLCNGAISELLSLDLEGKILAAAPDKPYQLECARREINFKGDNYFNPGVLLVNIPLWKKLNVSEQAINYLLTYRPRQLDMDSLNIVCANKVYWLKQKYNLIVNSYEHGMEAVFLHYTGADKPWKPYIDQNKYLNKLYLSYLEKFEPNKNSWHCLEPTDQYHCNKMWFASAVHDYKMMSKLALKQGQYLKFLKWRILQLKEKIKRKGVLNVLLCK